MSRNGLKYLVRAMKVSTLALFWVTVVACVPAVCCTTDEQPPTPFPTLPTDPAEVRDHVGASDSESTDDGSPLPSGDGDSASESDLDDDSSGDADDSEGPPGPTEPEPVVEPVRYVVFGDIQGGYNDVWPQAVSQVDTHDVDAALYVGDMIDTASDWSKWRAAAPNLPTFAAAGNHEYSDSRYRVPAWDEQFSFPHNGPATIWATEICERLNQQAMVNAAQNTVYRVDNGNLRLIVLNANTYEARREIFAPDNVLRDAGCSPSQRPYEQWLEFQRRWLEDELASAGDMRTVVMFHHPIVSSKQNRPATMLRAAWNETLQSADLVLTGHDHLYARHGGANGAHFVTSVTGRKFYPDTSMDDWNAAGVMPKVWIERTSTYGILEVGECLSWTAHRVDNKSVVDSVELCD